MGTETRENTFIRVKIHRISILNDTVFIYKNFIPFVIFSYNFFQFIVVIVITEPVQLFAVQYIESVFNITCLICDLDRKSVV
jgi:hypothetical protein